MLLALDVGNTQTVVGLFDLAPTRGKTATADGAGGGRPGARRAPAIEGHVPPGLLQSWRVTTVAARTADELALLVRDLLALAGLGDPDLSAIAVSSSVPVVTSTVREMVRRWFPVPLVVASAASITTVPVAYENPAEVGPDRLVDAVGALDLCAPPILVVDLGTATTFNVISAAGEYLGGAIVPGIAISMEALFEHASALRRIELTAPASPIGRSTTEALRSGAVLGYASLVDGMCARMKDEVGEATVIATGGLAPVVVGHCRQVDRHEPWLTLHGLRLVYERQATGPAGAPVARP